MATGAVIRAGGRGVWNVVEGVPAETLRALHSGLSCRARGFQFDRRYRNGIWDGRTHIAKIEGNQLIYPAGLTGRVIELLRDEGVPVARKPEPARLEPGDMHWTWQKDFELREYQHRAVQACVEAGRGVVKMDTGVGKTEVVAALVYTYQRRALVIVPSRELLRQTAQRFRKRIPNARVSEMGDGLNDDRGQIVVASYQFLYRNRQALADDGFFDRFPMVCIDECHHAPSASISRLLSLIPTPHKFGVSATPWTNELRPVAVRGSEKRVQMSIGGDLLLQGFVGPQVYSYSGSAPETDGVLEVPEVWMLEYKATALTDDDAGNWLEIYQREVINGTARNERLLKTIRLLAGEWGPTLVIVTSKDHGRALAEALGPAAAFMEGKTTSPVRKRLLEALGTGKRPVLISTVADEGLDVPQVAAVVLASGGRSQVKLLQRIGRGRRKGGQGKLIVVDCYDRGAGVLLRHSAERMKLYNERGWDVHWIDKESK